MIVFICICYIITINFQLSNMLLFIVYKITCKQQLNVYSTLQLLHFVYIQIILFNVFYRVISWMFFFLYCLCVCLCTCSGKLHFPKGNLTARVIFSKRVGNVFVCVKERWILDDDSVDLICLNIFSKYFLRCRFFLFIHTLIWVQKCFHNYNDKLQ